MCWAAASGVLPVAACVEETLVKVSRRAVTLVDDDVALGYRPAGDPEPLLPFLGALRFLVGVQKEVPTEWTAAVLSPEQAQRGLVDRRGFSATSRGPVIGEGGVIG